MIQLGRLCIKVKIKQFIITGKKKSKTDPQNLIKSRENSFLENRSLNT